MKESYDHQKQRKTKRRACWPGLGRPCEDSRNRNVRDIEMKKQDDDYPVTGKGESWKTDVDKSHQQKPPFNKLDWKKANTKLHSKDIIGRENRDLIKGTTKCPPGMLNCQRSKNRRLKDMAEIKRAMKCRPGMVNCRRRKNGKRGLKSIPSTKNGKRGLKGITKQKHCPQGWIFCIYGNNI